jgi:hypothetical protein
MTVGLVARVSIEDSVKVAGCHGVLKLKTVEVLVPGASEIQLAVNIGLLATVEQSDDSLDEFRSDSSASSSLLLLATELLLVLIELAKVLAVGIAKLSLSSVGDEEDSEQSCDGESLNGGVPFMSF